MASINDEQSFMQGLEADVSRAEEQASQQAKGIGSQGKAYQEGFAASGVRMKGRSIASQELKSFDRQLEKTITDLSVQTNFSNALDKARFEQDLRQKAKSLQLYLLKQSGEVKKQSYQQQLDETSSQNLLSGLTNAGSILFASGIREMGLKGEASAIEQGEGLMGISGYSKSADELEGGFSAPSKTERIT